MGEVSTGGIGCWDVQGQARSEDHNGWTDEGPRGGGRFEARSFGYEGSCGDCEDGLMGCLL